MHVIDVKAIRKHAGLSQEQLAQLLKTSWVTISRWERGVAQPSHASAQRLERLTEVLQRIGQALPKEKVSMFLQTPHPLLRGYRPIDLLDSDYGFHDLLAFVDAAKSGDMA
jgi:transcriptional regulator with XRE-family HTH domain